MGFRGVIILGVVGLVAAFLRSEMLRSMRALIRAWRSCLSSFEADLGDMRMGQLLEGSPVSAGGGSPEGSEMLRCSGDSSRAS